VPTLAELISEFIPLHFRGPGLASEKRRQPVAFFLASWRKK
jgi:hypothetical protein